MVLISGHAGPAAPSASSASSAFQRIQSSNRSKSQSEVLKQAAERFQIQAVKSNDSPFRRKHMYSLGAVFFFTAGALILYVYTSRCVCACVKGRGEISLMKLELFYQQASLDPPAHSSVRSEGAAKGRCASFVAALETSP